MVKMAEVLKELKRVQGTESINKLGDMEKRGLTIPRFSSGSLLIDHRLGGGWPLGRIIEVLGKEGSGKTTLALHAVAEIQKIGGKACYVDMEHALDEDWARGIGVNIDDLYFSQPDNAEQALEIVQAVIEAEDVSLIVVDSVSSLVPRAELEGDVGDSHMGLQARLMSQAMRLLTGRVGKTKTAVMFINQIRMKIGVVFGNPETTSGGLALGYAASIRVEVKKGKQILDGKEVIGNKVKVFTKKNKTYPPFKTAEVDLYYSGGGIRQDGELGQLMLDTGMIYKNGAMYTLPAKEDITGMLNGSQKLAVLHLGEIIKQTPKVERTKVKGYAEVLKALRQNINLQNDAKGVLKQCQII
jgi:recombination protein RecA